MSRGNIFEGWVLGRGLGGIAVDGFGRAGLTLFQWQKLIVADIPCLSGSDPVTEAIRFFTCNQVARVVVVDEGGLFHGFLESADVLKRVMEGRAMSGDRINSLVQPSPLVIREKEHLGTVVRLMTEEGLSEAVVVDPEGRVVGAVFLSTLVQVLWKLLCELQSLIGGVTDSVHDGVVAIDAQGIVIVFNKSAERFFDYGAAQVMGHSILEFFPESRTYRVLQTGQAERQCRYALKDLNLLTDFLPIVSQEKLLGAVAILKDVTELEAVTGRLDTTQELTATLQAVVENSYEGIIVIDDQERVVLINQFFLEVMELRAEDVVGKHVHEVMPESQLPYTLKTGIAQFGEPWRVGGREFLIMRIPIQRDGKIVGALGKTLFKNMEIAKMFAKKVMRLEDDLAYYKEELNKFHSSQYSFDDIIGENERMVAVKVLAQRASRTTSTILLLGESGTGKEVFAHAIHQASLRRQGPFIRINCAALPENLLESELFGYAEGAFTGARKGGKPGKFELADKGTIFLDEIGDMSLGMQAKLLRVIQDREVERLGGTRQVKVDVRLLAATNHDLHRMVMEHKFRLDLYYRLNVVTLELPALRERGEDLPAIVNSLLGRLNRRLGTFAEGLTPEALTLFRAYEWPGNIRELENVLERAMIISDEPLISPEHLSLPKQSWDTAGVSPREKGLFRKAVTLEEGLFEAEGEILRAALQRSQGNKVQAAQALGIHRSALYKKLARHSSFAPFEESDHSSGRLMPQA